MSDWDTVGQAWEQVQRQHLWRQHSDEVNGALCARWLPVEGLTRLLQTGLFDDACTGGLYPRLPSRARAVVGIDLSHCTARAARARHPNLRTITTDVLRLPFADGCVDAIVSNSTVDHFAPLGDVVAGPTELHRVLRQQVGYPVPANPDPRLKAMALRRGWPVEYMY